MCLVCCYELNLNEFINNSRRGTSTIYETIGEEVNFITYIESTDSTKHDSKAIDSFIQYQEDHDIAPSEIFGDTHYNTKKNIENLMSKNVEMRGPVAPVPKKETTEKNQGFSLDQDKKNIICPAGIKSEKLTIKKVGTHLARFPKEECSKCERIKICQPEKKGKKVEIMFESDILKKRRELMTTYEFKKDMHQRNGIEGTISGLVRGQGMRRSRYRGKIKSYLQNKLIGASANISRLHRYNEIARKREQLIVERPEDLLAA